LPTKLERARPYRVLSFGRPGNTGTEQMGAKCGESFWQRERVNATTKHQKPNTGIRVFNALSFAHQPNRKFERDPNASHPGPSTLALGFFVKFSIGHIFWHGFVL
jgi:hypothetical protein